MTTTLSTPATPATAAEALYPAGALALSPTQAAQALQIPRTKIFALLASKRIRSIKCGRYRLIPTTEIAAFLQRELEEQNA